jgi:hypothetical protein
MPSGAHSIVAKASPENRGKFSTVVSGPVSSALMSLSSKGLLRPTIQDDHAKELIDGGYAEQTLGGIKLTDTGNMRAVMELG